MVFRSSVESEYRVMTQTVYEVLWVHQLLEEVGFNNLLSAKIWCDNQAAI